MRSRGARAPIAWAALALVLLLAGCETPTPRRTTDVERTWTMHEHHHVSAEDSTEVFLHYPTWAAPRQPALAESLNMWTRAKLLASWESDTTFADTTALIENFLTASARTHGEFPDHAPWLLNRRIERIADTLGVVSLAFQETSFLGGAHPNAIARHASFDARTGKAIGLDDLFAPAARESLRALGETAFRAARGIAPDADLGGEGFWFEGNRFAVPDDFAVEPRGLRFQFDAYEVGPYALGPTEFVVPWESLRPLLRTDGPLAAVVRPPS